MQEETEDDRVGVCMGETEKEADLQLEQIYQPAEK